MDGLERRLGLLEARLEPPRQHVYFVDYEDVKHDKAAAVAAAKLDYETKTGEKVAPGDLSVILVRWDKEQTSTGQ